MKLKKTFFALAIITAAVIAQDVQINEMNFPDEYFRNWILTQDYGQDGILTPQEITRVKKIDMGRKDLNQGASNLIGIEYFTALEVLICNNMKLTELDVSKNTKLVDLQCFTNKITTLNTSNNPALKYLNCERNDISALDVSKSPLLDTLNCFSNNISNLSDLSNNPLLTCLELAFNQLTELDVSKNTELIRMGCDYNRLTELDVSNNVNLTDLTLGNNEIAEINVANNPKLTVLQCHNNKLEELDISNNPEIGNLICYGNQISELNLSGLNNPLIHFDGIPQSDEWRGNQFVYLTLQNMGGYYGVKIDLNELTNLADGVRYENGILIVENTTIMSSPFVIETGKDGYNLSGAFIFTYDTHEHDWTEWSNWTQISAPTCTKEGLMQRMRYCISGKHYDTEEETIPRLTIDCDKTPGYLVLNPNIVSDKAKIFVVVSESEKLAEVKIKIFDAVGNIMFEQSSNNSSPENPIVWNLRNRKKRLAAVGTYFVIAEVKTTDKGDGEENSYIYSAKLGVKR